MTCVDRYVSTNVERSNNYIESLMTVDDAFYIEKLKEVLREKQISNKSYSMRAFARDLMMSHSTLSLVLLGKKSLPKKNIEYILEKLELSPVEETKFRSSMTERKSIIDGVMIDPKYRDSLVLDESHYKVIAEWEYFAFLALLETNYGEFDLMKMAQKIGITSERAMEVWQDLNDLQFIKYDKNGLARPANPAMKTTEDISSEALKHSHIETLEMGIDKLNSIDVSERDFSSIMIPANKDKLSEAKVIIREFRQKMATLLERGEQTEVFQLAIQLYPITNTKVKNP